MRTIDLHTMPIGVGIGDLGPGLVGQPFGQRRADVPPASPIVGVGGRYLALVQIGGGLVPVVPVDPGSEGRGEAGGQAETTRSDAGMSLLRGSTGAGRQA